mgnify:CR=1 FL=1
MKCGAADGSYHRIFRSLLMSSDLLVPLPGGGALLQIHGLQDGILPIFLLDAQHGLLEFFLLGVGSILFSPLLLLCRIVGEQIQLFRLLTLAGCSLVHQMIGADTQPPEAPGP